MKRLSYAMLVAALFAGALSLRAAWAQDDDAQGPQDGPPPHEMSAAKFKDKLGLTDEQVTKLDALMKEHEAAIKPLRRDMRDSMNKLKDQVEDKASDADIQATLDKLSSDRKATEAAEEKMHTGAAAFLSSTQRAKILIHMMAHRPGPGMGRDWHGKKGGKNEMGKDGDKKGPPPSGDKDDDDDGDGN